MENRLVSKLKAGKVAFGINMPRSPMLIGSIAQAGLDFVMEDTMHGSVSWADAHHIATTCKAYGLSSWLRVESNPWPSTEPDRRVAVHAARAISIGFDVVTFATNSVEEVRQCLRVQQEGVYSGRIIPASAEVMSRTQAEVLENAYVMPRIETVQAIEILEKIMSLDGLRCIAIAGTDITRALGHGLDYEHPDVWKVVDKAVAIGQKRRIWVQVNAGYPFMRDPETCAKRIKRLYEHGVNVILLQGIPTLIFFASNQILEAAKAELGNAI